MKKVIAVLSIAIFAASIFSGCIDSSNGNKTDTGENFSFTTIDGEHKQLSDYRGKVVILDMMATWCQPCQYEMLELLKIYKNYSRNDLEILSVDVDSRETAQQLESYRNAFASYGYNLDWVFGMDDDGSIANKYLGQGIPTLCIFDQEGNLKFKHEGVCVYSDIPPNWPSDTQVLKPIIDELLNKT
ncbi:MAG TPA: TlpA family protein disulfide reductase [Thermoplasmatales archaeon]|nr:TlpA family protein disulfide reductase [Thermoplasmatales archaeon]